MVGGVSGLLQTPWLDCRASADVWWHILHTFPITRQNPAHLPYYPAGPCTPSLLPRRTLEVMEGMVVVEGLEGMKVEVEVEIEVELEVW